MSTPPGFSSVNPTQKSQSRIRDKRAYQDQSGRERHPGLDTKIDKRGNLETEKIAPAISHEYPRRKPVEKEKTAHANREAHHERGHDRLLRMGKKHCRSQ